VVDLSTELVEKDL
jgi:outer membrane murein-binding lipoprotein Lpp